MDDALKMKLLELANQLVWKGPDLNVLREENPENYSPLANFLQDHIRASHDRGKLILPDLEAMKNDVVMVFSDYAGEGSGDYNTYSFLICAWKLVGPFHQQMADIREKHGLGNKEIAFKDFRMGQLRRAIPDYLQALDIGVPGFLFTLVVDKRLITLFGPNDNATLDYLTSALDEQGFGSWKPDVAEKLLRVAHVGAFLTALLCSNEQKLFWMSDDDAICANEELHRSALRLFYSALDLYKEPGISFGITGGGAPFKERHLQSLDLLSATDVVASSVEHYLTKRDANDGPDFEVKAGSDQVLQWLAHDGLALKKMNMILRPTDEGRIQGATLEFSLQAVPDDVTVVPVII